jgi:hypothetical protein
MTVIAVMGFAVEQLGNSVSAVTPLPKPLP